MTTILIHDKTTEAKKQYKKLSWCCDSRSTPTLTATTHNVTGRQYYANRAQQYDRLKIYKKRHQKLGKMTKRVTVLYYHYQYHHHYHYFLKEVKMKTND